MKLLRDIPREDCEGWTTIPLHPLSLLPSTTRVCPTHTTPPSAPPTPTSLHNETRPRVGDNLAQRERCLLFGGGANTSWRICGRRSSQRPGSPAAGKAECLPGRSLLRHQALDSVQVKPPNCPCVTLRYLAIHCLAHAALILPSSNFADVQYPLFPHSLPPSFPPLALFRLKYLAFNSSLLPSIALFFGVNHVALAPTALFVGCDRFALGSIALGRAQSRCVC